MRDEIISNRNTIVIENLGELSGLDGILRALIEHMKRNAALQAHTEAVYSALGVVSTALEVERAASETGAEINGSVNRFSGSFYGPLSVAIRTFEQQPDRLTPYMTEAEVAEATIFFPPTTK